jgi:hypothetical protein
MAHGSGLAHDPDELVVPFVFVPGGTAPPEEWLMAHPGWVRVSATLVPSASEAGGGPARVAAAAPGPYDKGAGKGENPP